jgi:hypothetical protein
MSDPTTDDTTPNAPDAAQAGARVDPNPQAGGVTHALLSEAGGAAYSGDLANVHAELRQLSAGLAQLSARVAACDAAASRPACEPPAQTPAPIDCSSTDPLSTLNAVIKQVTGAANAGSAPGDPAIRRWGDTCKCAMTEMAKGHYPAGYGATTTTIPQRIAYQLAVRDAYISALGLLLDAARARDPYAPQFMIA